MSWEIRQGDCIERMAEMEEASVDAVVCDPPYGIDFMGKEWDSFSPARVARHAESVKRKGTEKVSEQYADRFGKSQGGGVAIQYDESPSGNLRFQWWCEQWARECLRVLKPGGHLLACGGSRTHHRLVCGIENAGFEIRDRIDSPSGAIVQTPEGTLAWYFGSGFPKGKDVHKALVAMGDRQSAAWLRGAYGSPAAEARQDQIEAAVAELEQPVEDAEWDGWNVALKPAHEPIVVARKPLIGTVAENVLEHGTGGINVDGCRVGTTPRTTHADGNRKGRDGEVYGDFPEGFKNDGANARWPANVVLSHLEECESVGVRVVKGDQRERRATGKRPGGFADVGSPSPASAPNASVYGDETITEWNCTPGCPVAELDAQSGERPGGGSIRNGKGMGYHGGDAVRVREPMGDSGGASRFFYCAKISPRERNAGTEFDPKAANHHPTVKPINLMRWLVRLVTPPGGLVLDPFLGSGTTGCAAVLEGFDFIGIEREAEYITIAEARIAFWAQHEGREVEDVLGLHAVSQRSGREHADRGQLSIEEAAA